MERVWNLTLGQPWLVNALAQQACFKGPGGPRPEPTDHRGRD